MNLSNNQGDVLNYLIDLYENSATYKGQNKVNQSFFIHPQKVFRDYDDDFANQDEVEAFNLEMVELESEGLISLSYRKNTEVITKIVLNINSLDKTYSVLGREDITLKRNREIELYSEYLNMEELIDRFCLKQIGRLKAYKDAEFKSEDAVNILKLLKYILENPKGIMERELSIDVLGDTKKFREKYRNRICNLIENYGDIKEEFSYIDDLEEKRKAILEEYSVFSNPSYVFLKGNAKIEYKDGYIIETRFDYPIAISSETFDRIKTINIYSKAVVTVENLTAYNRIADERATFIFLSGYHNSAKQRWLKKIAEGNKGCLWYHFGDIDPDGFYILKNLIEKTGIDFKPLCMGIEELKKYSWFLKPLEKNDIIKANSLIDKGFYPDVMEYILNNNCKLEQEIISWLK